MKYYDKINKDAIPNHIAVIMDGNGRWAKARFLPRVMGHKAGVDSLKEIVKESSQLGVGYLTLYAFSTENWKRPDEEVNALMKLLDEVIKREAKDLHKNNVRIMTIGDITMLPDFAQKTLADSKVLTQNNDGLTLTLALNYGSRNDIKNAIIQILHQYDAGNLSKESIDDETLRDYLSTYFLPDPDLIIRPSGEYRLSNFLMWEGAYAEFWFSDINWPDFKKEHLHQAIYDYQNRDRRFGTIR